jgi:hypothetical protein
MSRPTGCRCWTSWRTAPWKGRTHRTTDLLGRPRPLVKDAPFGVEAGEAVQVEWDLGLADVGNHDLVIRIAAPDHNPAGVHEGVDAFGGTPGSCSGGSFVRRPRP